MAEHFDDIPAIALGWHRDGTGWRCNGGSHFISSADIPGVNAE